MPRVPDAQSRREFEQFVERELPRLNRLALSLTGHRADAEDLVQEALAKAFLHWSRVTGSSSPSSYVRTILTNTFLSGKRRRASTEVVSSEVVDRRSDAADPTESFVQQHALLSQVLRLPPNQRVVIVLRYLEDLSVPEVAQLLGKREGAVRALCHRGLENLRAGSGSPPVSARGRAARASA